MQVDWHPLRAELAVWRAANLPLPFWWRDDDAIEPTPALDQLLIMAERFALPVHLAVIPHTAKPALAQRCADTDWAYVLTHGWAHENTAPYGKKKAEFGHPHADTERLLVQAHQHLKALFGGSLLPVFVPPWNRISPDVTALLPKAGFKILSTFMPRLIRMPLPGLVQINTHIDPIHWRAGGSLLDPEVQITALVSHLQDRRAGRCDATEPLGLLTHHLVHDADIWHFTDRLLNTMLDGGATPTILAQEIGAQS